MNIKISFLVMIEGTKILKKLILYKYYTIYNLAIDK